MADYKGKFSGEQIDERLSLAEQVPNKADKNGKYSNMTVGFAENLIGRGDTQEAYINFRPSAGADTNITDGAARIKKIKGNSLVWNQAVSNADFRNGIAGWGSSLADIYARDGYMEFVINAQGSQQFNHYFATPLAKGHKYAIVCDFKRNTTAEFPLYIYFGKQSGGYDTFYSDSYSSNTRHISTAFITTTDAIDFMLVYPFINAEVGTSAYIYSVRVVDLTKMFTAGNEPTTVVEYHERKPMNIADECEYSDGAIVDMKIDSLVSVGDNAWDEEWENGTFDTTTGVDITDSSTTMQIRSKNLIKVLPNTNYTCTIPTKIGNDKIWCMLLDKDGEVITGYAPIGAAESGNSFGLSQAYPTFTTPTNAAYLKFYCVAVYGDVYTNDICIHLEQSGYKNGQYSPYEQDTKYLSWMNDYSPRSAGTAYDEIRYNPTIKKWEEVKRIGEVNLGTLNWYADLGGYCTDGISQNAKDSFQATCAKYYYGGAYSSAKDKECGYIYLNNIFIKDSSVSDASALKQSLQGVILYYELAEPVITPIEGSENWNMDYLVWDFGTEEAIASVPSAPFRADINYEFNAVDDIRWAHSKINELLAEIELLKASQTSDALVE